MNLKKTPMLYSQYSKAGISNNRIFAVLLCLKHLLGIDRHWLDFVGNIDLLFDKYSDVKEHYMGFPENWKCYLIQM